MKPVAFNAKRTFSATFPMNVTNASNTLAAIANRKDTPHVLQVLIPDVAMHPRNHIIPLADAVVAGILGPELAHNFPEAVKNYANHEYFALVSDRLYNVDIVMAYTREGWLLMKLPGLYTKLRVQNAEYGINDLMQQEPNGYNGTAFNTAVTNGMPDTL